MLGLMQNQPLLISNLIEFAERHHGDGEVVSRRVEGDIHRYTWADVAQRARQVANALDGMKLQFSDRVATLAWNGYRHLELYFGVSGSERVLHTINPRLHPDQVVWIANHAEDQVLCFDMTFLPLVQAVQQLQSQTRCEPMQFLVQRQESHPALRLQAGQDSGLRPGDRVLLMQPGWVPGRLLDPRSAEHLALSEVVQTGQRHTEIRQLAGPPLARQGEWVALPL